MTFQGGDITVWSDQGNINAGKGAKAAINASLPTILVHQRRLFGEIQPLPRWGAASGP